MRILLTAALASSGCTIGTNVETSSDSLELTCYGDGGTLAATVEHRLEAILDTDALYVRLTLDPDFVDNTFGKTAIGWAKKRDFNQLVGSDHAQLVFSDAASAVVLDAKLDYISIDAAAPSGYGNLGVTGGDGKVLVGDPESVLDVTSSLARNLGERGYGTYVVDSPGTDADYTPAADAPEWEYLVIYEAWIDLAAFGTAGFGGVDLDFIHASPSKLATNTVPVEPIPCPPPACDNPDGCAPPTAGGSGPLF
jgi:hypothetical protein